MTATAIATPIPMIVTQKEHGGFRSVGLPRRMEDCFEPNPSRPKDSEAQRFEAADAFRFVHLDGLRKGRPTGT